MRNGQKSIIQAAAVIGFLSLASAASSSPAAASAVPGEDRSWLVRVGSVYPDESTGKREPIEGIGFIVRAYFKGDRLVENPSIEKRRELTARYFVFTASHLSQGESAWIQHVNGGAIKPLGRLASNAEDLEILEIPRTTSLATYDRGFFRIHVPYGKSFGVTIFLEQRSTRTYALPIGDWISGRLSINDRQDNGLLLYSLTGTEKQTYQKTAPGMSGSPLLESYVVEGRSPDDLNIVGGVASRTLCSFDRSYFSTTSQLRKLFHAFLQGKRGTLDATHWRMRKGLTFQDLGNGTWDINPTTTPTGNGGSHDTGNGGSHDTGRGKRAKGSKDPWTTYGISPGMRYRGEAALGFRVDTSACGANIDRIAAQAKKNFPYRLYPYPRTLYVHASISAARFLESGGTCLRIAGIVPPGSDLGHQIQETLDVKEDQFQAYYFRQTLKQVGDYYYPGYIEGLTERMIHYDHGRIHIQFFDYEGKDYVTFELDEKGRHGANSEFRPEIQARGKLKGDLYTIDISGLYFARLDFDRNGDVGMNLMEEATRYIATRLPGWSRDPFGTFFGFYRKQEPLAKMSPDAVADILTDYARPVLIYRHSRSPGCPRTIEFGPIRGKGVTDTFPGLPKSAVIKAWRD